MATERLVETLKQQAQIHAMEARTANAIIAEIYQLCTGASGEPGNWNGADPVRKLVAELEACRKDAERYRWLRDKWWFCGPEQGIRQALCPVELDSAIDAAMAAIE